MNPSEAEQQIHELFTAYGAAFDDADPDSVTAIFAYPAVIWQFGEGHLFEDEEELAENVEALIDVFTSAGIVLTTPEIRRIVQDGSSAFVSVAWRQEDQEGEALHEFGCQYMLVRRSGAWLVSTVVNDESAAADEPG